MGLRVAIFTVGCRANQADSDRLARALDPRRVEVVDGHTRFDLAVINTCCVTAEAERDCRKLARRALRASPGAEVIVTGCAVSAIPGFGDGLGRGIVALGHGEDPVSLAGRINDQAMAQGGAAERAPQRFAASAVRSRPLIKVQSGCTHGCAYCVVPAARGPERSEPLAAVVERAAELAGQGFGEIVLTGVQLGAWGRDLPGSPRIAKLLGEVADRVAPGRVRLSSIEPWSVDEELLDLLAGHDRVCAHLHVPLQSGDDRVLAAMGRGYRAAEVVRLARRARKLDPDLALGTDVICGFPGEDHAAFLNTLAVLGELQPSYVHVFPFSARPGTRAARMAQTTDRHEIRHRVAEVIAMGQDASGRYRSQLAGQVREVVVEAGEAVGFRGLTDNFVPVSIDAPDLGCGQLIRARLGPGGDAGRMSAVPVPA